MKELIRIIGCIIFVVISHTLFAQVSSNVIHPGYSLTENYPTVTLPFVDVDEYKREDQFEDKGLPPRFGAKIDVSLSHKNAGSWSTLADGSRVWRLRIQSSGAYSLSFLFKKFHLPVGSQLFFYNDDRSTRLGAFTSLNNKQDSRFATVPIPGDAITIEYHEPASVLGKGVLRIENVIHAYQNLFDTPQTINDRRFGDSGPCNIDAVCPESAGWEQERRSIGMIIIGGNRSCTGAMINTTNNDGTPYFLTANHCMAGNDAGTYLGNWVFVFNYESPTCNGPDGNLSQSIAGATVKATNAESDFSLLELSLIPPSNYAVFYAGWDKSTSIATNSTCIHHPKGDVKKISFNEDPLVSSAYNSGNPDTHWEVTQWENGTTEGGSSGSPLFNQDHKIIGQLQGGTASCTSNSQDYYGKLSLSWLGGGNPSNSLNTWLDPSNTGMNSVEGDFYNYTPLPYNLELTTINYPLGDICESSPPANINVTNLGDETVTNFQIAYQYDGLPYSSYNWSGSLSTFESTSISLPPSVLSLGNHNLEVIISQPNGVADEDLSNNTESVNFNIISGELIMVELTTDNFPGESYYTIKNLSNTFSYLKDEGFETNALNSDPVCLPEDCYTFTVYDTFGDGITPGKIEITWQGYVISSIDGSFLDSAEIDFCIPPVPTSAFSLKNSYCIGEVIAPKNLSVLAESYLWSFPGANSSSSTDPNPEFYFEQPGDYDIQLTIVDIYGDSHTSSQSIRIDKGGLLLLELTTDNAPQETSFTIVNKETGEIIASRDRFGVRGTLYSDYYCLADGCYDFVILDGGGNGLCCEAGNGLYKLTQDEKLIGQGTLFDFADTVSFCVANTIIEKTTPPDYQINIFPVPTSDFISVNYNFTPNQIIIWSSTGQYIETISTEDSQNSKFISLVNYPSGFYLLQFQYDDRYISRKIVVY